MYATLPIYYPSYPYAREHNEVELWRESHRIDMECKGQINRRAMESHNSRELDLMIEDLVRIYGLERTMCVLSRSVQFRDWDERISEAVRERAKEFDFQETSEDEPNSKGYILQELDPWALDYLFRRLMEREAQQVAYEQEQEREAALDGQEP